METEMDMKKTCKNIIFVPGLYIYLFFYKLHSLPLQYAFFADTVCKNISICTYVLVSPSTALTENIGFVYPAMSIIVIGHSLLH